MQKLQFSSCLPSSCHCHSCLQDAQAKASMSHAAKGNTFSTHLQARKCFLTILLAIFQAESFTGIA
jgi:hypothetical protein